MLSEVESPLRMPFLRQGILDYIMRKGTVQQQAFTYPFLLSNCYQLLQAPAHSPC